MRPEVGSTRPMIMAMVVVLPAPLPPSNPVMLPRAMRNDTPSTARVVLYSFTRCATSIAGDPVRSAAANSDAMAPFFVMRGVHWAIAAASARQKRKTLVTAPTTSGRQICGREPARLNFRHDRRCCLRFPPSAALCPSGYDPAAALARGARTARRHFHCGAGARIRRPDRSLRHPHRPVRATLSGAADHLPPDAAAGAGLCVAALGHEHCRIGCAFVLHRRIAEPVFIPVPCPGSDFRDRAADPADDRARGFGRGLCLRAGILLSAAAVGD